MYGIQIVTLFPVILQVIPNADLIVPRVQGSHGSKIFLPARDDAAEFDDSAGTAELRGLVDDKVGRFKHFYLLHVLAAGLRSRMTLSARSIPHT